MLWYLLCLNKGRSFHHINIDGHTLGSLDVLTPIDATIVAADVDFNNHTLTSYAGFFFNQGTFHTAEVFFFKLYINIETAIHSSNRPQGQACLFNRKVFSQMKLHAMDNTSEVLHSMLATCIHY